MYNPNRMSPFVDPKGNFPGRLHGMSTLSESPKPASISFTCDLVQGIPRSRDQFESPNLIHGVKLNERLAGAEFH